LGVEGAQRTTDVSFVMLSSVPFGFTGPVVLAFFTADQFFVSLEGHVFFSLE
jgi:hypothetical protein